MKKREAWWLSLRRCARHCLKTWDRSMIESAPQLSRALHVPRVRTGEGTDSALPLRTQASGRHCCGPNPVSFFHTHLALTCVRRPVEISVLSNEPMFTCTKQSSGDSEGEDDDDDSSTRGLDAMGRGQEEEHVPFVLGSVSGTPFFYDLLSQRKI